MLELFKCIATDIVEPVMGRVIYKIMQLGDTIDAESVADEFTQELASHKRSVSPQLLRRPVTKEEWEGVMSVVSLC